MAYSYGTSTAITITPGTLTSGSNRSSAAVTTGTTNNAVDYLITVNYLTSASAPSGNKQIVVYAYGSEDGTSYGSLSSTTDNVDGTDKALTAIGSPTNLVWLGTIQLNQGAVAVTARGVFRLGAAFPAIPAKWGIVLHNDSGVSGGGTTSASYREVYYS